MEELRADSSEPTRLGAPGSDLPGQGPGATFFFEGVGTDQVLGFGSDPSLSASPRSSRQKSLVPRGGGLAAVLVAEDAADAIDELLSVLAAP